MLHHWGHKTFALLPGGENDSRNAKWKIQKNVMKWIPLQINIGFKWASSLNGMDTCAWHQENILIPF